MMKPHATHPASRTLVAALLVVLQGSLQGTMIPGAYGSGSGSDDGIPAGLRKAIRNFESTPGTILSPASKPCTEAPSTDEAGCAEKSGPIDARTSPNLNYFEALSRRGMSAPLQDYLKLWYPDRPRQGQGDETDYIVRCAPDPESGILVRAGEIPQDCAPDVLYSWGNRAKLGTLRRALGDHGRWKGRPNPKGFDGILYASPSAVGTYMYGAVPVRLKIRPGTRYRVADEKYFDQAVTYRDDDYQDYRLADASVIESWSTGTPEHYDEIVRDILRISSGETALFYEKREPEEKGLARVFSAGALDGLRNDERTLKATLLGMVRMILKGEGRIHYSAGACRSRARHFATDKPTYMNP